ncbi:hypothetical protein Cylst_0723 [Cylindrospermum stagnale PCC 7417]|uniref:DUF2252 domain-containing protein n=1 Tax=Cylindrospermum stagnale PCC 7417 TaxID=56107 RepID=K9WTE5_9NOST|nr:DUF2252 domain-containing protein [Cylindrospermum stagnale]AFZ23051.1 hypothetical protein Cylst_0723 [Cylindrospermum stagnale PCC 7417]
MTNNIIERIEKFNKGRNPERLKLKYKNMRDDVFTFYRGTCHLFYEDFPKDSPLNAAPSAWICGDLHLENLGSYKGNNRLVYFDINDFDESCLAPCTWDVVRAITSIIVGSQALGVNESEALHLNNHFLDAYTNALAKGKARSVEKETAKGLVKDLLESLKKRDRQRFLDERTKEKKGKRRLIIDNKRTAEATESEQHKVKELIAAWHKSSQQDADFYHVLDVQQRIAGTGSLGLERYVILVEGKGSPDENYLLDFKETRNSSLQDYLTLPQPQWESPAARVVALQKRLQGTSLALLEAIVDGDKSYVLRELQPTQDKVNLKAWDGKLGRLEKLMQTMGEVTAWDQLRSSGRQGSATADDLINFAHSSDWRDELLKYASSYSQRVEQDYQEFCQKL